MNCKNSGIVKGTSGSGQVTIESFEARVKVEENEDKSEQDIKYTRNSHLEKDLPKTSPMVIPKSATITAEKKEGYDQVKYIWKKGEYSYICRWHTRTPGAPPEQGNSWVVQRDKPGIGYGKNACPAKHEILVGKGKWVSRRDWQDAIRARKNGTATQEQKEMLDNGHWKAD